MAGDIIYAGHLRHLQLSIAALREPVAGCKQIQCLETKAEGHGEQ